MQVKTRAIFLEVIFIVFKLENIKKIEIIKFEGIIRIFRANPVHVLLWYGIPSKFSSLCIN